MFEPKHIIGTQKNGLNETDLLRTENRIDKKIIHNFMLNFLLIWALIKYKTKH